MAGGNRKAQARDRRPRVVIVGAGFGGLWAARTLAGNGLQVILLDRNNYHTFQALLYQVAAAELEPADIAHPVRSILRRLEDVHFMMAAVQEVDFSARAVRTRDYRIAYDWLILALGSQTHYYAVPGAKELSFPLKTLEDAIDIRNHILRCFERAAREPSAPERERWLTFAIVGGGATGVEFAGALAELIRGSFARDFPAGLPREARVVLLEAQDRLLPGMPVRLQEYARERLSRLGVQVWLRSPVERVEAGAVYLRNGTALATQTVVWTAGVRGHGQAEAWGLPTTRDGRVRVAPTLQVPEHPEVYVIGDLAYLEENGRPLPMLAPVAIQQGVAAARNILRQLAGQSPQPFRYRDRGVMATIGRNAAVARVGRLALTGFPAWLLWLGVHLVNLIGFRNRLLVLINWAWDYFFFERAVRLILPSEIVLGRAGKAPSEGLSGDPLGPPNAEGGVPVP